MSGPVHRPPLPVRALIAVVGVGALTFNALLMLADRAPRLMQRVGGAAIRRLFERIDADGRAADLLHDPRLPDSDTIVHVAVWAVAVVLIGGAVWSWIGLLVGAAAVLACSLVIEALQGRWSQSRSVEASDAAANLVGVLAGTVVVAACYGIYSALSMMWRGIARR